MSQDFPGLAVYDAGSRINFRLVYGSKVSPFRKVAPEHFVTVLYASLLPGTAGIDEVYMNANRGRISVGLISLCHCRRLWFQYGRLRIVQRWSARA